jgi:hypothetical protein
MKVNGRAKPSPTSSTKGANSYTSFPPIQALIIHFTY